MPQRSPERRTIRVLTRYRPLTLVAVSAFILGGIAAHLEARWPHWHVDFGDVPTWTAAIAAIIAGWFGARAFRLQRIQIDQLRKGQVESGLLLKYQAHEAARAFARQVKCNWMAQGFPQEMSVELIEGLVEATVRNESDGAITNVAFRLVLDGEVILPNRTTWDARADDDGHWAPTQAADFDVIRQLPVKIVLPDLGLTARWNLGHRRHDGSKIEIRFTDEPGTRWHVARDGKLSIAADDRW